MRDKDPCFQTLIIMKSLGVLTDTVREKCEQPDQIR